MDTTSVRTSRGATVRAVAPLVVVNALAVYGQLAYAMESIAPAGWPLWARVALSIGFAAAVESVALYVGWHAHDALLLKSHATARSLRRWSFLIAAAVAAMNYAHFAAAGLRPTAAACAFGLLSLLSPWMWGLHTRRAARLQLLKEQRADETGAEFSSVRRRAFPLLTWHARRYSIMNNISDPLDAWTRYIETRTPDASVQAVRVDAQVDVPLDVDTSTPMSIPRVPRPRLALTSAPTSGGPAIAWDVSKVVTMIQQGRTPADVMDACGVSAKVVQRATRVVRAIASGAEDASIVSPGNISIKLVQSIRTAMEVAA